MAETEVIELTPEEAIAYKLCTDFRAYSHNLKIQTMEGELVDFDREG